jgi:hypothetical protein
MSAALIVDEHNELKEVRKKQFPQQPAPVRILANIISYIFHPAFVPFYVVLFMVYVHPFLFAGMEPFNKLRIMLMGFLMFTFFPLVTVLLLRGLKFIDSVYLHNQKDRIIPLVACGVWFFWITYTWWNSYKMEDNLQIPWEAVRFALASFIASWLALMINIKMKVSLHAIAVGVMATFIVLLGIKDVSGFGIYISIALFIAGLVCTARLIVSDHTEAEVYVGLAAGILAMLVAQMVG